MLLWRVHGMIFQFGLRLHESLLGGRKINVEFTSRGRKTPKRTERLKEKNRRMARMKRVFDHASKKDQWILTVGKNWSIGDRSCCFFLWRVKNVLILNLYCSLHTVKFQYFHDWIGCWIKRVCALINSVHVHDWICSICSVKKCQFFSEFLKRSMLSIVLIKTLDACFGFCHSNFQLLLHFWKPSSGFLQN